MFKIRCLIFLLLAMCGNSLAQTVDELPLQIKISADKIKKPNEGLFITAEITNISSEKVVIDKNALGYAVSFSAENETFLSQGEVGTKYEGTYLVLSPEESYKETKKIDLDDDFFKDDKKYQLSIIYGQFQETMFEKDKVWQGIVKSNQISFYLRNGIISKCDNYPK